MPTFETETTVYQCDNCGKEERNPGEHSARFEDALFINMGWKVYSDEYPDILLCNDCDDLPEDFEFPKK